MVSEFNPMLIRFYRHCKTCESKCGYESGIFGCINYFIPVPPMLALKVFGEPMLESVKRIWFDKNCQPVRFWRQPTQEEWNRFMNDEMSAEEWQRILQDELEILKCRVKGVMKRG